MISREEYEARNTEMIGRIDKLSDKMDTLQRSVDMAKTDNFKLIATSAINFIVGSGATGVITYFLSRK